MKLYNTLTKKIEEFLPADSEVKMFVCGPTVYGPIHIGNARTFTVFDAFAKYLRQQGYKLTYIQNITDIDDKIIKKAAETGKAAKEIAEVSGEKFFENISNLGIDSVDKYAKASEHIEEVKSQVKKLINKGFAYEITGDGWYFDLKKFEDYGKLSGRTVEMAEDGVSRIDESSNKKNKGDFCLWKFNPPAGGEPSWPAEFGEGRPGWHIEDTAITEKYFGPQYDLHGGGQDLMFPHHEAEIAQQESASGLKPFVKYWMHTGFLINKNQKMSKSLANFMTLEDALGKYSPQALRFYFLSGHYRSPLDYSEDNIKQAEAATNRIGEFLNKINSAKDSFSDNLDEKTGKIVIEAQEKFNDELANDFNSPKAFAQIFELIREINPLINAGSFDKISAERTQEFIKIVDKIFGIVPMELPELPEKIKQLIAEREEARKNKNYAVSDMIRNQIIALGYQIDDTTYGSLVKKVK